MSSVPAASQLRRGRWAAAPRPARSLVAARLVAVVLLVGQFPVGVAAETVRFATYNASLNRGQPGQLAADLANPTNLQARSVAEVIQRVAPDVLLVNEFDYDPSGTAARLFQDNFLAVGQQGASPIAYPYQYLAPVNTGVSSGFDLDNNGAAVTQPGTDAYANDAFGFGRFPGQFGMLVLSKYPLDTAAARTFQQFLWRDMPGALLPDDPATPEPADWFSTAELEAVRLSSKNHWDLPVVIDGTPVHFLVSHPTPPTFDGPEDRNGRRNHDEIRLWADYVDPARGGYLVDDAGRPGGLPAGAHFVIAGDLNADPLDGDSTAGAADRLLTHPLIDSSLVPTAAGGTELAGLGVNRRHRGDPAADTADFSDSDGGPGNLRVDYVLPSETLAPVAAGVFWPSAFDPLALVASNARSSDHRLVWVDVEVRPVPEPSGWKLCVCGAVTVWARLSWLRARHSRTHGRRGIRAILVDESPAAHSTLTIDR